MSVYGNLGIMVVLLLLLLFSGMRVACALGMVGFVGLFFMLSGIGAPERIVANLLWNSINQFALTPVPLFVLMGEFLILGKLNEKLYDTLGLWIGRIRGGLCHATTLSCAVFAAMSGSSIATAATLGSVSGKEMVKVGYSSRLAYGSIAAGGTLGILIPPSIPMIIYGNLGGVSIGHCFLAGIIPGIIVTLSFVIVVYVWGKVAPTSVPISLAASGISLKTKLIKSCRIIPVLGIILVVLGGIYAGVTTPTEAAAVGALASLLLCFATKTMSWNALKTALFSAVRTTSFILIIVACASIVSFVMQYMTIPELLTKFIVKAGIPKLLVLLCFYILYFALGMFIDPVSMIVMTVPTILPAVVAMGFDPIWFAVVVTMNCEIALLTPPVGLNLYVVQGISGLSITEVSKGVSPFIVALIVCLILISVFPGLSLWLPNQM